MNVSAFSLNYTKRGQEITFFQDHFVYYLLEVMMMNVTMIVSVSMIHNVNFFMKPFHNMSMMIEFCV